MLTFLMGSKKKTSLSSPWGIYFDLDDPCKQETCSGNGEDDGSNTDSVNNQGTTIITVTIITANICATDSTISIWVRKGIIQLHSKPVDSQPVREKIQVKLRTAWNQMKHMQF